jgi:hypothetical protein
MDWLNSTVCYQEDCGESKNCISELTIADYQRIDCGDSTSEESSKFKHLHAGLELVVMREDKGVCWWTKIAEAMPIAS